jgi:uncharacterized protein YndB with AHSA1/START domain
MMASATTTELRLSSVFRATPERLYAAWTEPRQLVHWLFRGDHSRIERIDWDLAVGGRFSMLERSDSGDEIDHFGEFLVIDRPHRLRFTLEVPKHFAGRSTVDVAFQVTPEGTLMEFTQTGVAPEMVEGSWRMMFTELARVLLTSE